MGEVESYGESSAHQGCVERETDRHIENQKDRVITQKDQQTQRHPHKELGE
jgi:hypothetical protein